MSTRSNTEWSAANVGKAFAISLVCTLLALLVANAVFYAEITFDHAWINYRFRNDIRPIGAGIIVIPLHLIAGASYALKRSATPYVIVMVSMGVIALMQPVVWSGSARDLALFQSLGLWTLFCWEFSFLVNGAIAKLLCRLVDKASGS